MLKAFFSQVNLTERFSRVFTFPSKKIQIANRQERNQRLQHKTFELLTSAVYCARCFEESEYYVAFS